MMSSDLTSAAWTAFHRAAANGEYFPVRSR
jgi:hypothetical protein